MGAAPGAKSERVGSDRAEGHHRGERSGGDGTARPVGVGLVSVVVLGATALNLVLLAHNAGTPAPAGAGTGWAEVATAAAYVALGSVGLFMVTRGRDPRTGWILLVASLALTTAAAASEYATYGVLTEPGSLPAAGPVAWFGAWAWWAGAGVGTTYGLLLYPDGSLPSPRWRPVAHMTTAGLVLLVALHAFAPGPLDGEYSIVVNPVGIEGAPVLRTVRSWAWVLLALGAGLAGAAVVTRLRTAAGAQRRQLQAMMVAAIAVVVAAATWGVAGGGGDDHPAAVQWVLLVALLGVPLALASTTAHTAALRRSVERMLVAREEERRRIRRDLHDGLGPTLAGVALQLDVARSVLHEDPAAVAAILDRLHAQVQAGMGDIRRIVDDLRPPVLDQLGLVSAIREGTSLLDGGGHGDFTVTVEASDNLDALPPAMEVAAFRIVMEAVTNASRHGRASTCRVTVALDRALGITVEDDGCGVSPVSTPGVGLASMRERATEVGGTCTVESRRGGGTVVRVELPVGR